MSTNFRRFATGIQIVPTSATAVSLAGDIEVDSVSGAINYSNGVTASLVLTANHQATLLNKVLSDTTVLFGNAADTTKALKFDLSGATTGKTLTIAAPVTLARTLTLPDATDTLVGKATIDVLSNKTIDVASNTISNIANANIASGAAIAYSKLALTGSIVNADLAGGIAYSKLALTGAIVNADLAGSISYSKLSLANSIVNADVNSGAGINLSKTDKLFDTEPTFTQVATPANPAASKNKLYPKSDGYFYSLDSSGAERKIGSGAGGVNYFQANPDIEGGTTGFSVGTDGAGVAISNATPSVLTSASHGLLLGQQVYLTTTGTLPSGFSPGVAYYVSLVPTSSTFQLSATLGGASIGTGSVGSGLHFFRPSVPSTGSGVNISPTATIVASTSTALRGTKNLLFTPGNVGDYWVYTITPDAADAATMLQFSFDYKITTPASYVDGDLQVYLYDVGNSVLIQPAPFKILGSSLVAHFNNVFQTPGTSMSTIRVIVVQNTPNTAYGSVRFDNFQCGPQMRTLGAAVTDWTAYVPTFSAGFGTVTSIAAEWRRVGDTIQMRGTATAGIAAASAMTITFPGSYAHVYATDTMLEGGFISSYPSGTQAGLVPLALAAATGNISFGLNNSASGFVAKNGNSVLLTSSTFSWWASARIAGWSSNVLMSQDTDTRVVAALIQGTPAITATLAPIIFPTINKDTHAAYNAATGQYTAPVGGWYQFSTSFSTTSAGTTNKIYIYKNAVAQANIGSYYGTTSAAVGTGLVFANAGDLLDVRMDNTGTGYGSNNSLSIQRLTGPAAIAATETVACRYTNVAGTTLTKSATTAIPFATKDYDTHGAFVTDTFTTPISGKYRVACNINLASGATWASGDQLVVELWKNGSVHTSLSTPVYGAITVIAGTALAGTINCLAGDTIKVICAPNKASAGNLTLSVAVGHNSVSIERVGN